MTLEKLRVRGPGLRLAAAALLAVAGLGLVGCEGDTLSQSTTGGQTTGVRDAHGSLTGGVKDNNGNPIPGAQVFVAGRTTTTDAGGQWLIENVPVVNVQSNVNNEDANLGTPLTVTIVAAGHLGANVVVKPEAIVTSSQTGSDDGEPVGGQTNPQVIWFDGFLASSGDVKLPRLNATIKGTLRDAATGTPLVGTILFLDFNRIIDDQPEDSELGEAIVVTFAAGTGNLTATTGANGTFQFNGVPADSCMRMYADGFNLTTDGGDFGGVDCDADGDGDDIASVNFLSIGTNDEAIVNLNVVFATISPDEDDLCPVVASVDDVLDQSADPGLLESPFVDTIVVNFNEPVDINLDAIVPGGTNPLRVIVGNFPNFENAAVQSITQTAPDQLTIVLVDPVAAGENVDVRLPREAIEDIAGNNLCTCESADAPDAAFCPDVGFDVLETRTVFLDLEVFQPGSVDTGEVTIEQVTTPVNAASLLFRFTSSFVDVVTPAGVDISGDGSSILELVNEPTINQLNQDVEGVAGTLQDLANARVECDPETSPDSPCVFVDVNTARVRITTATDAATYAVAVLDGVTGRPKNIQAFPVPPAVAIGEALDCDNALPPACVTSVTKQGVITNAGQNWWIFAAPPDDFDLVLIGDDDPSTIAFDRDFIVPGDIVEVIALADSDGDGLGDVLGEFDFVVLVDHVPPTTALQDSYQELIDYGPGVEDGLPNASGCFNQAGDDGDAEDLSVVIDIFGGDPDGAGPLVAIKIGETGELPEHAGLTATAGGSIGDGGEIANPGPDEVAGDRCIGVSPFLMIDLGAVTASAAHVELVSGRSDDFDPTGHLAAAADQAYDEEAFASWVRPSVRWGVAFTEDLDEAQTVGLAAGTNVTAGQLSGPIVQNNTNFTHLPLSGNTQLVDDLVVLTVDDPLDLANVDHFHIIDFTGIQDASGVVAGPDANARVRVRDMWAPYVVDAERAGDPDGELDAVAGLDIDDGDLVIQFNEPVVAAPGDRLDFTNTAGGAQVTFTFGAANFDQSADGTIILIEAEDLPPGFAALFGNPDFVFDDDVNDSDHLLMDWRSISDRHGNAWENYELFDDGDADEFDDAVPEFLVEDLIGIFTIDIDPGETVVGDADAFVFALVGTQPVCNWFASTEAAFGCTGVVVPPEEGGVDPVAIFSGTGGNCAGTIGVTDVVCDRDFVTDVLRTGACAPAAAGTSATFSADLTSLTFEVDCGATALTEGDVVGLRDPATSAFLNDLNPNSTGQSAVDPTQTDSAADTTTAE